MSDERNNVISHELTVFLNPSIPYVRFDGKMSAKRRQETIARFSVPLEDDEMPAQMLTQAPSASAPVSATRATRQRRKSTRTNTASSEIIDLAGDDAGDGDFVVNLSDDDDDDFIDDSDEDDRPKKKGKGKAKAKGKAKKKAAPKPTYDLDDGVNPKVMLISLKAGALGLNLTVANNVYL